MSGRGCLVWAPLFALASCAPPGKRFSEWDLDFAFPLEQAKKLEVEVLSGGCAPEASVIHRFERWRGENGMGMPAWLKAGRYGLRIRVIGIDCRVIGEVCEEVQLPWEGRRRFVVPRREGESVCGRGETCVDGRCVREDGGNGDGGPDGWVIDTTPIDASSVDAWCERCGGANCVDLTSDPENCGGCGVSCPSGPNAMPTCSMGNCGIRCADGYADCDRNPTNGCEVNLRTRPAHCGACGVQCGVGETCVDGRCICGSVEGEVAGGSVCGPERRCCLGTCVDIGSNSSHCGECNRSCRHDQMCIAGLCRVGECPMGYGDCDGNEANGCETQLNSTENCGRCGRICQGGNARWMCSSGRCVVSDCIAGYEDCNLNPSDGCEVNLSDIEHCGSCNHRCPAVANAMRTCSMSRCAFSCNPGFADCNGQAMDGCEVNLNTNPNHCGGCNIRCAPGEACMMGRCVCGSIQGSVGGGALCVTPNNHCCNGACVDTLSNSNHCGRCGVVCSSGTTCHRGNCVWRPMDPA
ncbi:MAG: hypothetical protein RMJ84_04575 [Sandaracinaceae bacterium]|nr:hypothetical protein [Sandaracinaceae bacterium]